MTTPRPRRFQISPSVGFSTLAENLYVRDFPGGGPAFVLLHGFPDNSRIYDELIPHLAAAGRRSVTFEPSPSAPQTSRRTR